MSSTDSMPELDWRGGQTHEQLRVSRTLNLWFTWLLAIALLAGVGYLLYRVITHKVDRTLLVTVVTEGSDVDRLACPPIEYQWQTRSSLAALPTLAPTTDAEPVPLADMSFPLENASGVSGFGAWLRSRLDTWDPRSFWGRSRRVLLVYVCAQGLVAGDKAYFIGGDFSLADDTGKCEVGDLLEQIATSESDVKVVLIDTGRLPPDPRIGFEWNDFPEQLAHEVARLQDPSLWVLCANSPGETAALDYPERRTRFGSSVARALQGDADAPEFGGNDDKCVTLSELYGFVLRTCQPEQTPFLVRGQAAAASPQAAAESADAPADRTIPADICLVKIPPPPKESDEPSGAEKLAAKTVRTKTSKYTSPVRQQAAKAKSAQRKVARVTPKSDTSSEAAEKSGAEEEQPSGAAGDEAAGTAASGTGATGPEAGPDTQWLDRLDRAWSLHDQLAYPPRHQWPPALFMPQLWRNVDAWLIELEQRLRFGSDEERDTLLENLDEIVVGLESLQASMQEAETTPRGHSALENRLTAAWRHFAAERNEPESLRYVSSFRDPLAQAMRTYQLMLFRAVSYVRWYDRACRSKANPLEQYNDIERLLTRLSDAGELLRAESSSGDLDRFQTIVAEMRSASLNLDAALVAAADAAAANMASPEYQADSEALLGEPLLPAETRMKLLRAAEALRAATASSDGGGPVEAVTTWQDPASPTPVELARLSEALLLQARLVQLYSPTSANEVRLLVEKMDTSLPYETQRTAIAEAQQTLRAFYADVPQQIRRYGVTADEREVEPKAVMWLRIVDPRDVESNTGQAWTTATGLAALPERLEPTGPETVTVTFSPDVAAFKFDAKEVKTPLTIRFAPELFKDEPLVARFSFDPPVVTMADAATGNPVAPDEAVPVSLGKDNRGALDVTLAANATKGGAAGNSVTMTIQLVRGEGPAALPAGSKSVRFALPPEDDVLLGCRRDGTPDNQWSTSESGRIELRPFANRETSFQFALRNTSEKARTVTVELFAVKRPARAVWAPGWIPDAAESRDQYQALLFDRGGSGTRPNVTRVAPPVSVTLSPDPDKWELIPFGQEAPKAEPGGGGSEPAPKPKEAAAPDPGPLVTDGLVCRILDPAAGENWARLKWIAISPRRPSVFLDAKAKYEFRDRRIAVDVAAREINDNGQPRYELPAGLAKQPVQLSLVPVDGFGTSGPQQPYNGSLTDPTTPVTLALDTPDEVWNSAGAAEFRVALDVDQWPRAMEFVIRCNRNEDANGIELRTRKSVQIERIATAGDEWVYIYGSDGTLLPPAAPAEDPNKRPPVLLTHLDDPAFFPERFADQRLQLDFRVDVPTTSFVIPDGRDAILVQSNQGDLAGPFYSDRQMTARVREFREGWLVLFTQIGDYSVQLAPTRDKNKIVPIEVALQLRAVQGTSNAGTERAEARKIEVFMDGKPPEMDQLPAPQYIPRELARTLGATVRVTLTVKDDSGIDRVLYRFYREGTPAEEMPLAKDRIRSNGTQHVITIDIPTDPEKLQPGVYQLRVKVVDLVQNELLTPPIPVTLAKPMAPGAKAAANLTIVGIVQLKGSGIRKENAEVTLKLNGQEVGKSRTDANGGFRFEKLEDGSYEVSAKCEHNYRDCTGTVSPVKPQEKWARPVVIEVSSSN